MKQIQNESGALIFFPNTKNAPARVKPSSENVRSMLEALGCVRWLCRLPWHVATQAW